MHPDKICHMCGGTGRNMDGDTCPMCGARVSYGRGRIRKEIFVQGTNHDEWPIAHPNLFGYRHWVLCDNVFGGRVLNPPQQFMGYAVEFRLRKMRCRV
jgi:hypothetical protein